MRISEKAIMAKTRVILAAAGGVLCTLPGCSGDGDVIYNKNFNSSYSGTSIAAMRVPIPVETYGTPSPGASPESVSEATIRGLRTHGPRWAQLNFATDPEGALVAPYRLRIAYGTSSSFSRADFCREDLQAGDVGVAAGSNQLVAAVCFKGRYASIAEGRTQPNADVKSEEFSKYVGLIGRQILPRQNPRKIRPERD